MNSTVGGPNQIAVLTGGHAQFVEQPKFPPITATGFKFRILATLGVEGSESRVGRQMGFGSFVGRDESFTLYFKDSFTRVQQRLDEAYFAGNVSGNAGSFMMVGGSNSKTQIRYTILT